MGAVINMINENRKSSLTLVNSIFEKNFAQGEGGVLRIVNVVVFVNNSIFSENEANIGGVTTFDCSQNSSLCSFEARNCLFRSNKGT